VVNVTNPDLRAFEDRGGKLLIYHGWNDAAIAAGSTVNYYENIVAKMGAAQADGFLRLFMVPGMQHCAGGPVPTSFGQGAMSAGDPEHNIVQALEHWVEHGRVPNQTVTTKYKVEGNPASGVLRTRPLCAYPQVAVYKGSGSTDDAAGFTCRKP